MFNFLSAATIALTAASAVSALVIPLVPRSTDKPATYAEGYLEDYDIYHKRYIDLGCNTKHNTTFFDLCCHPMLATETLAKNRAPQCVPSQTPSSTVASTSVALPTESEDPECDDGDEPEPTPAPATPSPSPSVSHSSASQSSSAPISSATPAAPVNAGNAPPTEPTPTPAPAPAPTTHTTTTTSSTPPPPPPPPSTTSTTHTAAPTAAAPAAPANGDVHSGGFATFFFQNGVAGACGNVNPDSAFIAALDSNLYGDTGKKSPHCGQKVLITNTKNQKQVTVTVADACPTCVNSDSIDLSVAAFEAIATQAEGIVPITWEFA